MMGERGIDKCKILNYHHQLEGMLMFDVMMI